MFPWNRGSVEAVEGRRKRGEGQDNRSTRTSEVETEEAEVAKDGEDQRGHVEEREAVEKEVHGVLVRETACQESVPCGIARISRRRGTLPKMERTTVQRSGFRCLRRSGSSSICTKMGHACFAMKTLRECQMRLSQSAP